MGCNQFGRYCNTPILTIVKKPCINPARRAWPRPIACGLGRRRLRPRWRRRRRSSTGRTRSRGRRPRSAPSRRSMRRHTVWACAVSHCGCFCKEGEPTRQGTAAWPFVQAHSKSSGCKVSISGRHSAAAPRRRGSTARSLATCSARQDASKRLVDAVNDTNPAARRPWTRSGPR